MVSSKTKPETANALAAGRSMEMKRRQSYNLSGIGSVRNFIVNNGPWAFQWNGSQSQFDYKKQRKVGFNMKKIVIVYWSGTGNTEAMAAAVLEGAKAAGGDAVMLTSAEFDNSMLSTLDAIAFGCAAMGAEVLEESEFAPMFDSCINQLGGKKVALFGSYGWGDGEWMRTWEETCKADGAVLACDSVLANEAPDDDAVAACQALGKALC